MNCPFCHAANRATSRACQVCGGPLSAQSPRIAGAEAPRVTPVAVVKAPPRAPVAVVVAAPGAVEIARRTFAEGASSPIHVNLLDGETPRVCLVRADGGMQLWDAQGDAIAAFSIARLFRRLSPLCGALAARDFVTMGYENGEVRWHDFNGRARKSPAPHVGRVLALSASETQLYSGGSDGVIWATALDDRKAKSRALIEGLGAMRTFAVAPDATLIAVGCDDGAVQCWRVSADGTNIDGTNADGTVAKLEWTRRGHDVPVGSLAFSPNGQMIVSRDRSGQLALWAARTSYQLPLGEHANTSHVAPAFSSDNRLLALVKARNVVSIFDVALGTLFCELPPFAEPITHLAFAPAGTWLVSASERAVAIYKFN